MSNSPEQRDMLNGPYTSEATPKFVILYRNGHEIFRVSRRVKGNENSPTRMAALTAELNSAIEELNNTEKSRPDITHNKELKEQVGILQKKLAESVDHVSHLRQQVQSLEDSNRWMNTGMEKAIETNHSLSTALKNISEKKKGD